MYFSSFVGIVSADARELFAALCTPLDGGGELVLCECEDDPMGAPPDCPSSQTSAPQRQFHSWAEKMSAGTRSGE